MSRIRSSVASQTQTSQQKAPVPIPQPQEPLLSTSPRNEPTSVPAVEQKTRERRNSDKLLSFDNFDEPVQPAQPGLVRPALLLSVLTPALPAAAAFSSDFLDFSSPSATPPVSYASTSIAPKNDPFGFDDITSASSVHRSQSGSSLPMGASPSNSNGSSSPMGMARVGGPMGGGPGGRGPMAMGAMGGRGNGPMGFDAFNVMNPTQQTPSTYRGQPGRR